MDRRRAGTWMAAVVLVIMGDGAFTTSMHASLWLTNASGRWLICSSSDTGVGG